ncbi:hypothetical protein DXG01_003134 [Tephrocybe rancida]|nr:hypothetical protein DXG01_003134 [Tephrocybe rancida]
MLYVNSRPLSLRCSVIAATRTASTTTQARCQTKAKAAVIKTLDPARLQCSDFFDASNREQRTFRVALKDGQLLRGGHLRYATEFKPNSFPSGTQGFLYWYRNAHLPPTTGEVRFRVTADSNPASFEQGTDLLGPEGALPWSLNTLRLVNQKRHALLEALAVAEGYLQPNFLAHTSEMRLDGPVLTFLEQPFVITVGSGKTITILTPTQHIYKQSVDKTLLPANFTKGCPSFLFIETDQSTQCFVAGKLLVRFEHSTFTEHSNNKSIVMRVLKILEPLQQGTEVPLPDLVPMEGALLKHVSRGTSRSSDRVFHSPILLLLPTVGANNTYVYVPPPTAFLWATFDPYERSPPPEGSGVRMQISPTRICVTQQRVFSTLDPRRLRASDFLDVSNTAKFVISHVSNSTQRSMVAYHSGSLRPAFPPATQGFLYLHHNPSFPSLTAEIRFRLVPSGDPAQFETSVDLFAPNRTLWKIPVLRLPQSRESAGLRGYLQDEGPPEVSQALSIAARLPVPRISAPILTYLEQPFVVDVSKTWTTLHIATPEHFHVFHLYLYPQSYYHTGQAKYAIRSRIRGTTGQLLLRFERSPFPEHALGNVVAVRVLKILEPVEFSVLHPHAPLPRPGKLLEQLYHGKKYLQMFDLDRAFYANLKHLPSMPHLQPNLCVILVTPIS